MQRDMGPAYRGFSATTEADARQSFERRYGVPPAEILDAGPVLLAGPLPGEERAPRDAQQVTA